MPSFSFTTGVSSEKPKLLLLKSSLASSSSSAAGARMSGAPDGQRPTRRDAKNSFVIGLPDAAAERGRIGLAKFPEPCARTAAGGGRRDTTRSSAR